MKYKNIYTMKILVLMALVSSSATASECVLKGEYKSTSFDTFLFGSQNCKSTSCLKALKPNSSPINITTGDYKVIYIPKITDDQKNSIVLGQVTYLGSGFDSGQIKIDRDKVEFACKGNRNGRRTKHFSKMAYSEIVNYKNFDRWHRYGAPEKGAPFEKFATDLHTKFDNGARCVATLDNERRVRFLFKNRNDIPSALRKIAKALFGQVDTLQASGLTPSRHLKVKNYRVDIKSNPCVTFKFKHDASYKTKIAIDDIENTKSVFPDFFAGTIRKFTFLTTQN